MLTRREMMAQAVSVAGVSLLPGLLAQPDPIASPEDLAYLRTLAKKIIGSATKSESQEKLGFSVITPGGDYPAFWIRDFSMAAGCGIIDTDILRNHLLAIARSQNIGQDHILGTRALIPPHAIPDHINYDGGAVFFPGTYSSGDDQGGEPYGVLPPVDDHYEFIHLAALYCRQTRSVSILKEQIADHSLLERLQLALECPNYNRETGLVETTAEHRAVGFGFCDGIYFTGSILFASLLRYRALREMTELEARLEKPGQASRWNDQRQLIVENLEKTFAKDGWLKAATGVGQQPDVWGTAFALCLKAVPDALAKSLRTTLVDAVKKGTITYKGAVRHVPTDHDFSATSAWEKTAGEPLNRYQNGAYWHVPTGWLAQAIAPSNPDLARQLVRDMVDHFRAEEAAGAPWECLHPDQNYRQNPLYMASVTLPLEVLQNLQSAGR
jgi:hypothetical protein